MAIIDSAARSEGDNVSEIQSLSSRVRDLTQSVDWWNTAMLWGLAFAAIAAIFVVIATRVVVAKSNGPAVDASMWNPSLKIVIGGK
jgi:hypothetical protein